MYEQIQKSLTANQLSIGVNQIFRNYDKDHDGYLSKQQTRQLYKNLLINFLCDRMYTETGFNNFFKNFDLNCDGKISKKELFNMLWKKIQSGKENKQNLENKQGKANVSGKEIQRISDFKQKMI